MRDRRRMVMIVAALAAALAGGCWPAAGEPREPIHLKALPPATRSSDLAVYQVRVVRLTHRQRPDAPAEDLWRLLGTTSVPYEKLALWESNDLRLGEGAQLAAVRLNQLAADTANWSTQATTIQIRENADFVIAVGGERASLDFLWSDASGHMLGRHFDKAIMQFRLICRSIPEDPESVNISLVPEVLWGPEEWRWVHAESGVPVQRFERAAFPLSDFAAEVRLPATHLLMLGGHGSAELSLGGAFFHERRGPDEWSQTVILTVQRTKSGPMPESGSVPLAPPSSGEPKPGAGPSPK